MEPDFYFGGARGIMLVQDSNLCARFYKHDGWDHETLVECIESGSWVEKGDHSSEDAEDDAPYWILAAGSRFTVDKIMEYATGFKTRFDERIYWEMKKFLEEMNG